MGGSVSFNKKVDENLMTVTYKIKWGANYVYKDPDLYFRPVDAPIGWTFLTSAREGNARAEIVDGGSKAIIFGIPSSEVGKVI